jgi:hypothetical protein
MDKAKAAVSNVVGRGGHHDTVGQSPLAPLKQPESLTLQKAVDERYRSAAVVSFSHTNT